MKKIAAFFLVTLFLGSCKPANSKEDNEEVSNAPKDSVVVNDKDENGCLASAGYIWSKVNKECVKVFTGIQLNPMDKPDNEDETLSAYVLFGEDANQAEVFLPDEDSSMVLNRNGKEKIWIFGDWQLVAQNGYILKKGDKDMFSGDAQIGQKVIGNHTE